MSVNKEADFSLQHETQTRYKLIQQDTLLPALAPDTGSGCKAGGAESANIDIIPRDTGLNKCMTSMFKMLAFIIGSTNRRIAAKVQEIYLGNA